MLVWHSRCADVADVYYYVCLSLYHYDMLLAIQKVMNHVVKC